MPVDGLRLERHFVPASIPGLLLRRHPYDFVETYRTLRSLYGYSSFYVNLGLWADGAETEEPGRQLAFRVAEPLQLTEGERLVDAGAGLGQAAVDLLRRYRLAAVEGLNVNPRQIAFARELAKREGLADRIRHVEADACRHLFTLPRACVHGVLALECVGHFRDPVAFLRGARHALVPGRRISFCLNVARRALTWAENRAVRASFGFTPASDSTWVMRLEQAGFTRVGVVDLTDLVTRPLCEILTARLAAPNPEVAALPRATRFVIARLQRFLGESVRSGRLGYSLITAVAEAP